MAISEARSANEEAFLDAAERLLVTSGYAGISVRRLADQEGLGVLLLEQNVGQALRIVDRVYVMRSGRVILEESVEQMRARDSYWDLF